MNFPSKIYIDGGDPKETRIANELLKNAGYHGLDGQTTNPSLIAKNAVNAKGDPISYYKKVVQEMSTIIPQGKISIQVIGDPATMTAQDMLVQARDRITWIPNGIIKLPCTKAGIETAAMFCHEGSINLTLNFSQEQGAAVYSATKSHSHDVFISPFVGRFDDRGEKGMDFIANELEMFKSGDKHVQIIAASIRNMAHLMRSLQLHCDIVTIPFKVFKEWADGSFTLPSKDYTYTASGLAKIPYIKLSLDQDWKTYDIRHDLTDAGVAKFWQDWKSIVQ